MRFETFYLKKKLAMMARRECWRSTDEIFNDAESAIASRWLEIDAQSAYETMPTVCTFLETYLRSHLQDERQDRNLLQQHQR